MTDKLTHILQQAEESYKNIYPGTQKKQPEWEKWFAQWLLTLSDIRDLLGINPPQSTLEKLLGHCNTLFLQQKKDKSWSAFMAEQMKLIVKNHQSTQKKG
ncbi:MAG: hypothetical protein COY81_05400 [Candidatus Pacebacteria bacterium CG_4_10_14_0_8_um_filter_43_12]|nr:MAG: hypothetical protein COU66_00170 [Candidatus Pacebacteria bacterium CG10_big_fil_rev_8_21_14_0_10_44_11]PIY78913.1 MAG: hypothetical protein COY81_05400 [Candidatus Pacebacteria bacterium CG_4_10_14_0_8_um_filter_43_12]